MDGVSRGSKGVAHGREGGVEGLVLGFYTDLE